MRQAQAKGARREMRRALGPALIDTIDAQAHRLHALTEAVNALAKDHAIHKQHVVEELVDAREIRDDRSDYAVCATAPLRRDFLGRFRWLLTGR